MSSYPDFEKVTKLPKLKELALEESHAWGQRKRLGSFAFGRVVAMWKSYDEGSAVLTENSVQFKGVEVAKFRPTHLILTNGTGDLRHQISFKMDLGASGLIDVHETILDMYNPLPVIRVDLAVRKEKRLGLAVPNESQIELLYEEMNRGASGVYTMHGDDEFFD